MSPIQHTQIAGRFIGCLLMGICLTGCNGKKKTSDENASHEGTENVSETDSSSGVDTNTETTTDSFWDTGFDGGNQCIDIIDTATATSSAPDRDTHSDSTAETDTASGTNTEGSTDTAGDTDTDGDADSDGDSDSDTDGDVDGDTDTDTDSDVDADTDADADPDTDGNSDPDTVTTSGEDTDITVDSNTGEDSDDTESQIGTSCPADMAYVQDTPDAGVAAPFCIDRFEASRRDADGTSQGTDETIAVSISGVIPWTVNPMSADALLRFEAACAAAGKRLCSPDEWLTSCTGPGRTRYVFGDTFDREVCNNVDTFCDDYCLDHDISEETCNLYSNCGYYCGTPEATVECFHVVPTGSFRNCTNALGTFDMNGNLWEVVPSNVDPRGYEVRGGAFNCASAAARLQCTYNADWNALYAGFRCCKDPG